jgi:orotate phosphoribosyltransferase
VSVSRAISSATDKQQAAIQLRDEINSCRKAFLSAKLSREQSPAMHSYKREFIEFALAHQALKFGSFTLKSGRTSPYFFNAGLFNSGMSMSMIGKFYAQAIRNAGIDFDVIFGPAYKGIPLATTISVAWYHLYGENKDLAYNRKEAKDHGEVRKLII